jgi:hypothetical protein
MKRAVTPPAGGGQASLYSARQASNYAASSSGRQQANVWQAYLTNLKHRPITTKAITAWAATTLGDLLAQVCVGATAFDWLRTVRLGAFALFIGGPLGHFWHRYLDRAIMPHKAGSFRAVLTKLALDQLALTPIVTAVFLSYLKVSEGRADLVVPYLQDKLVSTLRANYLLWPIVNLFAFRFVPGDLRILFCNVIGVLWGAYVSVLCYSGGKSPVVVAEPTDVITSGAQSHNMMQAQPA